MSRWLVIAALSMPMVACNGESPTATEQTPAAAEEETFAEMARSQDPADVVGRTWYWLGTTTPVERIEIDDPSRYTLLLHEGGDAEFRFDCNKGRGSYEIGRGSIRFGPLISTRAACPEDTLDSEYMRQLENVAIFFIEGGHLFIDQKMDSGTMRFSTSPELQEQ